MRLKLVQINIWKGALWDGLIGFLRRENPGIITMQEVTGGTENRHPERRLDLFHALRRRLNLQGALTVDWRIARRPRSYFGKAIFVRGDILRQRTVWLTPYRTMPRDEVNRDHVHAPRSVFDCLVKISGVTFHVVTVHAAWSLSPTDTPLKLRHARGVADYLDRLRPEPFVLAGDLNLPPGTRSIKLLDTVVKNAMMLPISRVTRTTHPAIHKTVERLPDGLLIDYVFHSPHFTVSKIAAPAVTVSDHLPVCATLEFRGS